MPEKIDKIDAEIINILQENGRVTNTDIAKRLGMAPSGILERIRKLERRGIVTGYNARLNVKAVNFDLLAFVFIKSSIANWSKDTSLSLAKIPHVLEVHEIAGEYSYLLKVRAASVEDLSQTLKDDLSDVPNIQYTQTTMVLKTIKESTVLPVVQNKK